MSAQLTQNSAQTASTALVTKLGLPVKSDHQLDYILLDGSGSMRSKWYEMLAAIDALMAPMKAAAVESNVIIHVFDSTDLHYIARDVTLADWRPLSEDPIGAHWGMTPLYDAINLMSREFRDKMPKIAAAYIVTDGSENGSDHTDETQARAMLDWMRANGWPVTFIGCDFNNSSQARALGADDSSAIGVQKKLLTEAATNLGHKRARHAAGDDTAMGFTDAEKKQFGGYLVDSSNGK